MTEWLVRHSGGGPIGPVSTTLLYRGIELGKVPIDAEVRPADGGDWLPLASYREFAGALQEEDIETKVVDSPWFLEQQQRSAVGGSAPLSSPKASPPPLPKTRAAATRAPAATPGRDTYESIDEDDEATRVAAMPDSAPMPRPAAGSPSSAPPAASPRAPALPKPSIPPLNPPPSSGPRNLPASAPTPSPRGPLPPMSRPPGSLPPVSRPPGSQPPASRSPAAAPAGPPRRPTSLGLGPPRSIVRPAPSPAPSAPPGKPPVEEDFDDEAMTKVMQSPRDAPAPPALPAGVPSSLGDRPFDSRRAPTMKIDPLRPAPTAYMAPATAPPQRTAAVGAKHEAPVVVRPDPEPRPAAPPAYARPYAPPFSPPPPEPPAFDATMKALIALIVVLAVALAIVLVLLARR